MSWSIRFISCRTCKIPKHAKKYADYLIVSITTDRFVNKGFGRPIFNQNQRAELLSSLLCGLCRLMMTYCYRCNFFNQA